MMPFFETAGAVIKEAARAAAREAKKIAVKSAADVAAGTLKGGRKETGWAIHTAEGSVASVAASDVKERLGRYPEPRPDPGDGGAEQNAPQEIQGEGAEPEFPVEISDSAGEPDFPTEITDSAGEPDFPTEITNSAGEPDFPNELRDEDSVIDSAFERIKNGDVLTDKEKGNLCEMMMDRYYISQGYTPINSPRVVSLEDKGHHGIDGVYEKDGKFIIADAKFGSARLQETQDGVQMSYEWIDRRLDSAVGKEKADEIRSAYEDDPGGVSMEVYHYDPHPDENGNTFSDVYQVNEDGERKGGSTVVEIFKQDENEPVTATVSGGVLYYER